MTVSSQYTPSSSIGNGVIVVFNYAFLVSSPTDITVIVDAIAADPSEYTVDDVAKTVTFAIAPIDQSIVVIGRITPLTQAVDYIAGDNFPSETHEDALDKLTLIDQETSNSSFRSIRFPLADPASPELPSANNRINKFLAFDALGDIQLLNTQTVTVSWGDIADDILNQTDLQNQFGTKLSLDGSLPMTGDLSIIKANPILKLQATGPADFVEVQLMDYLGTVRTSIVHNALNTVINNHDSSGLAITELTFHPDGNLSTSAALPTIPQHLANMRYVDLNTLKHSTQVSAPTVTGEMAFTTLTSNVKKITLTFSGISLDAPLPIRIQVGDGTNGYKTSGYGGNLLFSDGIITPIISSPTDGIPINDVAQEPPLYSGVVTLTAIDTGGTDWIIDISSMDIASQFVYQGTYAVLLPLRLDRIRLFGNGAEFDQGTANIVYE